MEFLKEALGAELYEQVSASIETHNSNEANKEKQIKLANLASGMYVNKKKHTATMDEMAVTIQGKDSELAEARELIEQLQKASAGGEDLKVQIDTYESENLQLKGELERVKVDYALQFALIKEKAVDVGYLVYKASEMFAEQGKQLQLDSNGKIKDCDSLIADLKAKCPNMFEAEVKKGTRSIVEKRLETDRKPVVAVTRKQFLKMPYKERAALKESNPDLYEYLVKSK